MCCDQRILVPQSLADLLLSILRKVGLPEVDISQVAIIEITLGAMSGGPPRTRDLNNVVRLNS